MNDQEWAKLAEVPTDLIPRLVEIVDLLQAFQPSVKIECPALSPSGVEVLIAGWANGSWATKQLATVEPGKAYSSPKLRLVPEFSGMKEGDILLVRPLETDKLALYSVKNTEKYMALLRTVTPHAFPYWTGTTMVRNGIIDAGQTVYSYLEPKWQDVIYYWLIS